MAAKNYTKDFKKIFFFFFELVLHRPTNLIVFNQHVYKMYTHLHNAFHVSTHPTTTQKNHKILIFGWIKKEYPSFKYQFIYQSKCLGGLQENWMKFYKLPFYFKLYSFIH